MTQLLKFGLAPTMFCIAWFFIAVTIDKFYLPIPQHVFSYVLTAIQDLNFWNDVYVSMTRLFIAMVISIPTSIGIGLMIGANTNVKEILLPSINFFRILPVTALIPLIIIAFGFSEISAIAIIIIAASIQTLIVSIHACDDTMIKYATLIHNLKLSKTQAFKSIIIPGSMTQIFPSIDLSINAAFRILIVAELFGAQAGLGYRLIDAAQYLNFTALYGTLFCIGIIGMIVNKVTIYVLQQKLYWR